MQENWFFTAASLALLILHNPRSAIFLFQPQSVTAGSNSRVTITTGAEKLALRSHSMVIKSLLYKHGWHQTHHHLGAISEREGEGGRTSFWDTGRLCVCCQTVCCVCRANRPFQPCSRSPKLIQKKGQIISHVPPPENGVLQNKGSVSTCWKTSGKPTFTFWLGFPVVIASLALGSPHQLDAVSGVWNIIWVLEFSGGTDKKRHQLGKDGWDLCTSKVDAHH